MDLNGDKPAKRLKPLALKFVSKTAKAPQVWEYEETSHAEDSKDDTNDEEMAFIIKIFQHLVRKNKRFSGRSSGFRGSG